MTADDDWDYEAQPWVIGHRAFVRHLATEGFRVERSTAISPEQIRGHLPSGESFYFRERWGGASLWVGDAGADPLTAQMWRGSAEVEGTGRADTEAAFRRLLAAYEASKQR